MDFTPYPVSSPLDPFIESIFHYKNFTPDHSIERVIPTGHIFIIFELDNLPRNTFDNLTLEVNNTFTKVWVSGIHKQYISISAHQDSEMLVIQFKPFGAYPFFHFPMQKLSGKIVSAQEVLGNSILELREEIYEQESIQEKFSAAKTWLEKRLDLTKTPPTLLLDVLQKLQTEPATHYPKIIEKYPHSQKHLIDQFKKYVGLTPKYFQRIIRFIEIFQQLQRKETIKWSQVAYQCGYADQSHFIKEFKYFSGFNPEEFIKGHDPNTPNFLPLDREG